MLLAANFSFVAGEENFALEKQSELQREVIVPHRVLVVWCLVHVDQFRVKIVC